MEVVESEPDKKIVKELVNENYCRYEYSFSFYYVKAYRVIDTDSSYFFH